MASETRFVVVVLSYNSPALLDSCLTSIAAQDYSHVRVIVVDDASPDPEHGAVAMRHCRRRGWEHMVNRERSGAAFSHWAGVERAAPDDDDVVLFVDGDDQLAHPGVLRALDAVYRSGDVWLTSGGCRTESTTASRDARSVGLDAQYAARRTFFRTHHVAIAAGALYRRIPWCFSHPVSFRAALWRHIDPRDLQRADGRWLNGVPDLATGYPLLELAGGRIALLDDVHYVYRLHDANFDADPRRRLVQLAEANLVRGRPPYAELAELGRPERRSR